jgi:hypothetical protein
MSYGYARVSTDGQNVETQIGALTAAGAEKVFREVASGRCGRRLLRRVESLATIGARGFGGRRAMGVSSQGGVVLFGALSGWGGLFQKGWY